MRNSEKQGLKSKNKKGVSPFFGVKEKEYPFLKYLKNEPHLVIGGVDGYGKKAFLRFLVEKLLKQNKPDKLKLLLIRSKKAYFSDYKNSPYLIFPILSKAESALEALKWCVQELERRFYYLKEAQVLNINEYNEKAKNKFPTIIVFIRDLDELMTSNFKEIENCLREIAWMGRAANIHLVISVKQPSRKMVMIFVNILAKVIFRTETKKDSIAFLDSGGAEKLVGQQVILQTLDCFKIY